MEGSNRPILLKKSAMVSTVEKYVSELEIFALSRGFEFRFRVDARKKSIFSSQYIRSMEGTTFSIYVLQIFQAENIAMKLFLQSCVDPAGTGSWCLGTTDITHKSLSQDRIRCNLAC